MKLTRSLATLRDGWGNPKLKAIQLYTHDLIEMQVDELETKKVYVASGWKYRNLVKNIYYPKIEEAGIEITHKWMMDEDGIQTAENYRRAAQRCVKGVQDADAVICVLPSDDYPYRGTNFELGVAHAMGIPTYIYNPAPIEDQIELRGVASNAFYHLPDNKHYTDFTILLHELTFDLKN